MADVWPSVSAKPESALFPKRLLLHGPNLHLSNLENFLWATIVSAFPRNYAVLWKVQRFLYLIKLCTFFRRCSFVIHVLLRRDLKDLGWQRIQICIWHWMAVLEEDINHGMYSPKGGVHQCCASTQKIRVPRVGSGSGYSEPSPNPITGQEPELRVPIFELTSNFPAPPSFTLNYPEPKPKGGSFTHN